MSREYDRIRYGCHRHAQDFHAMWTFGETLYDLSDDAYLLVSNTGSAVYATGWPTSVSYTFDRKFIVGHTANYMESDDLQRSLAGDLYLYRGPRKHIYALEMPLCRDVQVDIFRAIWASGYSFDFYEDADLPKSCAAVMSAPPEIVSQGAGYWQISCEIAEI